MKELYKNVSFKISCLITKNYSTSFYSSTNLFNKEIKYAIFSIYGFVRFADEIVDTWHDKDKSYLLNRFEEDSKYAIKYKISTNPVLHSFQETVNKYNIPIKYIDAFLKSMRTDIYKNNYNTDKEIEDYIYGSADVVGLMCLKIFCKRDEILFKKLEKSAMNLGSAFQKVNFLRDIKNDVNNLDRKYFPVLNKKDFDENSKKEIIKDIEIHFNEAYKGIVQLPYDSKLAVFIAYNYYKSLLKKIKKTPAKEIFKRRIRINNFSKLLIILKSLISVKLKTV